MTRHSLTLAVAGLAAGTVLVVAPSATAAPALNCPSGHFVATVRPDADFAKVHTSPGTGTSSVGQLASGASFCLLSTSSSTTNGHYWDRGYGYHGSTRLSGYVADDLLNYGKDCGWSSPQGVSPAGC